MPTESLELSWILAAKPADIYRAWLDSKAHSTFTGGAASLEPGVGGRFTAWDGYIQGKTLELEPDRRIVQSWRTTEFPEGSTDSLVELLLVPVEEGTRLTLRHLDIPESQGEQYRKGWDEFYITPMTRFFSSAPIPPKKAAPRKKSAKKAPARKATAKKTAAKKAVTKKGTVKKSAAKKSAAKKSAAKKSAAKKAPAKRRPPGRQPAPRGASR